MTISKNVVRSGQRLDIDQHILADGYGLLALLLEPRVVSFMIYDFRNVNCTNCECSSFMLSDDLIPNNQF